MRFVHYYAPLFGPPAGVTAAIAGWAGAQRAAGHHVTLLGDGDPAVSRERYPDGVEVRGLPHRGRGRVSRYPVGLRAHLRGADVLVLHEGWLANHYVAAAVARRAGVPYVVVPHGVHNATWAGYMRAERVRRIPEAWLLRHAAAVHVFFDGEIEQQRWISPGARCIVAPTGFTPSSETWTGGSAELLWIGRYSVEQKGLDLLLQALAALPADRRPRVLLRGIDYHGIDPRGGLAVTTGLVRTLDLADHVTVGPPVFGAEKDELLRTCAGYVLPSRWESHPIVLLETLGRGVPTLASERVPAADEMRAAGAALVCGVDRPTLAEGLRRLAEMPAAERAALGRRGRDYALARFDWPQVMARYERELAALPTPIGVRGASPRC